MISKNLCCTLLSFDVNDRTAVAARARMRGAVDAKVQFHAGTVRREMNTREGSMMRYLVCDFGKKRRGGEREISPMTFHENCFDNIITKKYYFP